MVNVSMWRVYVEFETASLQDADQLHRLNETLRGGEAVVEAMPAIGSRGSHYSLSASITVRSPDRDTACGYAKELLEDACADVGYQTGRVKTLSGTRR